MIWLASGNTRSTESSLQHRPIIHTPPYRNTPQCTHFLDVESMVIRFDIIEIWTKSRKRRGTERENSPWARFAVGFTHFCGKLLVKRGSINRLLTHITAIKTTTAFSRHLPTNCFFLIFGSGTDSIILYRLFASHVVLVLVKEETLFNKA